MNEEPRLLIAVTSPITTVLLRGQLAYARRAGFRVTLVCSPGPQARALAAKEGAELLEIPMQRSIHPPRDLVAFVRLTAALAQLRPDVVNASTPKAGLLVMAAATLTGVEARIFTLRGIRSETLSGHFGAVIKLTERATCRLAHRVICVGPSLRDRAIELHVAPPHKCVVLGAGSSNGIDATFFENSPLLSLQATSLRLQLGITPDDFVVGCVGRIAADKGIRELYAAFELFLGQHAHSHLLLVGGLDEANPIEPDLLQSLRAHPRIHLLGHQPDPRIAMAALDVLAHPSYREGFCNVLAEANALGLPVVASDIPGCRDPIANGATGLLVPVRNAAALAKALETYARSPELRREHGAAGRQRVTSEFASHRIWAAQVDLYRSLMARPASQRSQRHGWKGWLRRNLTRMLPR